MIKDALRLKEKIKLKLGREHIKCTERNTLSPSIFPITEKEVVYLTQEQRWPCNYHWDCTMFPPFNLKSLCLNSCPGPAAGCTTDREPQVTQDPN